MSGLVKAKKYDWKDSNLAMFGSDTEKQVKKASAESETAWKGAGTKVGLQIWRIVKFKIEHWPKEDYGSFYSGDSYIILNTYIEEGEKELKFDLHFWIGKGSTQDEYGTAAYKTVELDTFLNDAAVQHREVQNSESRLFKSYFSSITVMDGGAASGFRHVKPEEYTPKLLRYKLEKKKMIVKQEPIHRRSVTPDDVFILDMGLTIYLWRGNKCSFDEKIQSLQYTQQLNSKRCGKSTTVLLDEGDDDEFFAEIDKLEQDDDDDDMNDMQQEDQTPKLFKVSDESGRLKQELVKEGTGMNKSLLNSKDVFLLDTTEELFVWCGRRASKNEVQNGIPYAHKYLMGTDHFKIPVTVVKEGQRYNPFEIAISA